MVCKDCRDDRHKECREAARRSNPEVTEMELAGSSWCDCAHEPKQEKKSG